MVRLVKSDGRSPLKIYWNQILINLYKFWNVLILTQGRAHMGFAGPTADAWDDILETTSLAQWHVDSFHDSCYDSLDCFGDLSGTCRSIPITQLLRTRSKGWVGMWDGYQMSCSSLHCSEFEQLKFALLVFYRFQICGVFAGAAVDGVCSPQHSITQCNKLNIM